MKLKQTHPLIFAFFCIWTGSVFSDAYFPDKKHTFYGGAAATYDSFDFDVGISASTTTPNPGGGTKVLSTNTQTPNVNLFGGYQFDFGENQFVSGEIMVAPMQDGLKKVNIPYILADTNQGALAGSMIYDKVEFVIRRQYSGGVDLKYGMYFNECTAAFLSLGLIGSRFEITHRDNSPQSVSNNLFAWAYAPGAGFKYYIFPNMPLTFQYNYQIYNTFTTKNMDVESDGVNSIKYKIRSRVHNFIVAFAMEI